MVFLKYMNSISFRHRVEQLFIYVPKLTVVFFLIIAVVINGIAYTRSFIDDTSYHIPMAVEIARHYNPYYVDVNSTFTSFWFPAGAETLVAAIVALTRDIRSTNFSGALFFILFLLVSYKFAGLWTNDSRIRLLCVMLTGIVPVLFAQTTAFYVDIHLNFLVYLCLYLFALALARDNANYVYAGLGFAVLSASVKYHGVLICAVLLLISIIYIRGCREKKPKISILAFALICILFASGWYIRNLLLKGNPFYPIALPESLQTLLIAFGLPYQGMNFPNYSPWTTFPHPFIPQHLGQYDFAPHITDDAFGFMFPVSLLLLAVAGWYARRMPTAQRRIFGLTLLTSALVVIALPFRFSVPRYVLFFPAVVALWPAVIVAAAQLTRRTYYLMYAIVLILSLQYIYANFLDNRARETVFWEAIAILTEGRNTSIVHFDFLEQGNLRIGYVNGRFGFIATLYDQKLTNQLFQLHYQNYMLDYGAEFSDPQGFVDYIRSLDLDYICVFDPGAPGVDLILANFSEITFIEDVFK